MDGKIIRTWLLVVLFLSVFMYEPTDATEGTTDVCNVYDPSDCTLQNINLQSLKTIEDFDICGPALLPLEIRNYYLASSGRGLTLNANLNAFKSIAIKPRILRDVSHTDMTTTVLGESISAPIGLSPVGAMKLAHPGGEIAAARAVTKERLVMIVSSVSSTSLEEIAQAAAGPSKGGPQPVLWMQTYIYKNRKETLQVIRRAERASYKAIVVTVDSPVAGSNPCGDKIILDRYSFPNLFNHSVLSQKIDPSLTFRDLSWLIRNTKLPVVVKGVLNGQDAARAAMSGASAILVSNHGGRQLDSSPATIEVLPEIVKALKICCSSVEVYLDSGVRNGFDAYKALASGARAVFIGRPSLWGLAVGIRGRTILHFMTEKLIEGEDGVKRVLSILKSELKNTMMLAGSSRTSDISQDTIVPGLHIQLPKATNRKGGLLRNFFP